MGRSLRSQFLKRISSVGWGARESVQTILGGVVYEVRDEVADGAFAEADLMRVIRFHDEVEGLWRDSLATDPPLGVEEIRQRLDHLLGHCFGPLHNKRVAIERARTHLQALEASKQLRDDDPQQEHPAP